MRRTIISALIISGLVAQPACETSKGPNPDEPGAVGKEYHLESNSDKTNASATPAASPDKYNLPQKELMAKLQPERSAKQAEFKASRAFPMKAEAAERVIEQREAEVELGDKNVVMDTSPTPLSGSGPKSPDSIYGGVLNGKAISKPAPAYPPIAKAAKASGTVIVQITIDEAGKVISARAVSGHPLLQQAAVQAAYQARFTPTMLSDRPVKATGLITYNFVLQ
jgi:TonB family protein